MISVVECWRRTGNPLCRLGVLALAGGVAFMVPQTADAKTNTWAHALGGLAHDATNWVGVASDLTSTTANYGTLDFTALGAGEKVTITNEFRAAGLRFGSETNTPEDVWTLQRNQATDWLLLTIAPESGNRAEIRVDGGSLALNPYVRSLNSGLWLDKTGAGDLTINNTFGTDGAVFNFRVSGEGTVTANHTEALGMGHVHLSGPLDGFRLKNRDVHIGGLYDLIDETRVCDDGTILRLGGTSYESMLRHPWENASYVVGYASAAHLGAAPTNAPQFVVRDGDAYVDDLADAWRDCIGFWRFDIEDDPTLDSGLRGNRLAVKAGKPVVTNDAVRGNVLYLDGSSGLRGQWVITPAAGEGLLDQPEDRDAYTVALWVKHDPTASFNAAVYKFGELVANKCSFAKLNSANGMYTSHGGSVSLGSTQMLPNGATWADAWHHLAYVHDGAQRVKVYLDGVEKASYDWSTDVRQAFAPREFLLGYNWSASAAPFKGRMDDVAFFRRALTDAEIAALAADETTTARTWTKDQVFKFCGNGRVHLLSDQTLSNVKNFDSDSVGGGLTVAPGATLTLDAGDDGGTNIVQTFSGAIEGAGGVTKAGANVDWVDFGMGTWKGETTIAAGRMALGASYRDLVGFWDFEESLPVRSRAAAMPALTANNAQLVSMTDDAARGCVARITSGGYLKAACTAEFPSGDSSYTLSLWTKLSASCGNNATFCVWGRNEVTRGQLQFRLINSYQTLAFASYGGGMDYTDLQLPYALNDSAWHHLVVTYERTNRLYSAYLDGSKVNWSKTGNAPLEIVANGEIQLGSCWGNTSRWFDGWMDAPRVWARALTADEVARVYAGGVPAPRMAELPQPVAHYAFDDAANPGKDSSGNGYDLTVVGDVTIVPSPVRGGRARFGTSRRSCLSYNDGAGGTFPAKIPSGANSVTMTAWIETDVGAPNAPIFFWGSGSPSAAMILDLMGRDLRFVTLVTGGGAAAKQFGNWSFKSGVERVRRHFVAVVYDAPAKKLRTYLDGVAAGEAGCAGSICQPANFGIGGRSDNTGVWYRGFIDEAKVYDVPLTLSQVRAAYRLERASDECNHVLPEGTTPMIAADATLAVEGPDQTLVGVSGEGTLDVAWGSLSFTGASAFTGTLVGGGAIALKEGATFAAGDVSGFNGTVRLEGGRLEETVAARAEIPSGATLPLAAAPFATVADELTVGARGTVVGTGDRMAPGDYALATAGAITLPAEAEMDWTSVPSAGSCRTKLAVRSNGNGMQTLLFRVIGSGAVFIVR